MKKTYITPEVYIVTVATQGCLLEGSLHINNIESGTDAWVKGDRSAGRGDRGGRSDYNVWNEDWSQ